MTERPTPEPRRTGDLASALAALEHRRATADQLRRRRLARPHVRAILTLVFIALLVGGSIKLCTSASELREPAAEGSRASVVFSHAQTGTCLSWPSDAPEKPSFVQCRSNHMFEVAKPVGMTSFGEPCQQAVREYLGNRYDPNSRFTISVLWAGDAGGPATDQRNLLCGLQLLGRDGKPTPFTGRIAELDQSKVWAPGTCLGIDSEYRPTDIPVDCAAPHSLEVTGGVSLAERFPGTVPNEPDQRAFIAEACARAADAYLAPTTLPAAGLALDYAIVSPESWSAGSRQVSCRVGRPSDRGWVPTTGSARALSPADLPPPPAPEPVPPPVAPPPPPVYEEPLVPLGPIPAEAPRPPPASGPAPGPAPTTTATTTTEGPPAPLGPPPGPATPPPTESTSTGPAPGVIEIPGLPPFTLPGFAPEEPEPPAPLPPS